MTIHVDCFDANVANNVHAPLPATTQKIITEFIARAEIGRRKYGVTMDRTDLDAIEWLQHLREELMDGLEYATRLQAELKNGRCPQCREE